VRHVGRVEEDRGLATGTGEACRSMSCYASDLSEAAWLVT